MKISAVGIPWYRPETYKRLRMLFIDGDKLHDHYEAWLAAATQLENKLKRDGMATVRADIEPATFPAWCTARGLNLDAKARSQYANEVAYRTFGPESQAT